MTRRPASKKQGKSDRLWLAVSFIIAFLAIGAAHWPIAYSQIELPGSLVGPGLFAVVIAGIMARVAGRASLLVATVAVGSAAPAAIVARVIVDTSTDPASHNLWPIELVLSGMVGYACAAAGATIATVWSRIRRG